jgi:hypothetical protein
VELVGHTYFCLHNAFRRLDKENCLRRNATICVCVYQINENQHLGM